jgi:DNA-binding MarR family transcriptional regulator
MTQTKVDSYILTRLLKEIPPSEFVLYLALYELAVGSGLRTVALGIQGLSELTGLSKSSIQRLVKGLKKRGLISVSLVKPTATPEYEVLYPWRKAKKAPEKPTIVKMTTVKKNKVARAKPREERQKVTGVSEKSLELSISKLNIDENTSPKRKRRPSIRAVREAQDVARALAIFQQKEEGFKASLTEEKQKRWVEDHLKRLGPEAKTLRKNALGLDVGYQLAVEAWWKQSGLGV